MIEPIKPDPPKRKRRWFQFSLRTLLLFTVVCAIGCAWLARRVERKSKEREAVEAIVRLKGEVFYDYQLGAVEDVKPSGPAWLRKLLGENFFSEVDAAFLYDPDITDVELTNLEGLTELQTCVVTGNKVTDAGLVNISGLTHLQMPRSSGDKITDAGLVNLRGLTQLQELDLRDTLVSDKGVNDLQKALPKCNILR